MLFSAFRLQRLSASLLLCLLAATCWPSLAEASWRVAPIRLDFDQRTRSGVITLTNEGDEKITFSVEAAVWAQDETGRDVYTPSQDLVFFPKMLTIEPKQERVVRAGLRTPAGAQEKTWRLFVKEAAAPRETTGTAVAITLQFGVPIFAKPAREELKGEIEPISLSGGEVRATVKNVGNGHFRIKTITFLGKDEAGQNLFTQEVVGWYLLHGVSRTFTAPVADEVCRQLKTIDVFLEADRLKLSGTLDVDPTSCDR